MAEEHNVCNIEDSPYYVFRACARGIAKDVERLLMEDAGRATAKDTKGWTCMHHAASRDKTNIMDIILKYSAATINALNVDGDTPLHMASQGGRKNAVQHLLILGANPNLLNNRKDAPLHVGARAGHHAVVKELALCNRTNVDVKDKNGGFAIHIAARYDLIEVARELVAAECELCQPNINGFFPIHLAANNAAKRTLEIILAGAEEKGVSREQMFGFLDAENNSPLHSAVNGGHAEAVAVCLENGARVEARSDDGSTPFHLACNQGAASIVRLMLDSFRSVHLSVDGLIDLVDINGLTPLHRAATFDHPEIAEMLIREGATVEVKENEGRTPLLLAATKGGGRTLRLLIEAGASVTVRDLHSRNVFHFLVAHGKSMTAELRMIYELPKGRALLNQQDDQGCTPLHMATRQGNLAFIDSLLKLGATIGTKNNDDQSALHFAARYGRVNTVRRLLDHSGTIINETDGLGMTPLHVASVNGHTKVVTLLLQRGALVHKDFHGQTPLHLSAERNYTRTMKLLLSYHINLLDLTDKKRNTALHLAAAKNRGDAVELLLEMGAAYRTNLESKTPLDLCIQSLCTQAALTMIHHSRWNEFLSSNSIYGSPLLGLIQYLPHVYRGVLDRCRTTAHSHPASKQFWERFDFRHMEPPVGTAKRLAAVTAKLSGVERGGGRAVTAANGPQVPVRESLLCLNMMVRFGRVQLLSHPVSLAYLNMKWKAYGRQFFYLNLIFYMIFLSCMTWLLVTMNMDPATTPHFNETLTSGANFTLEQYAALRDGDKVSRHYQFILIFTFLFLLVNIIKELVQIYQQRIAYLMEMVNMIEWTLYISSAVFVVPLLFHHQHPIWEFGIVAVFMCWFNLLMHMQRTDSMGLYVVMFLHIFRTVVKVLLVFSVLFIGFGLAFFILLTNEPESGFNNPWIATTQMVMMMMGDWNFRLNFIYPGVEGAKFPHQFPKLAFCFLLIFVLFMPILFINLLIGLAVGDIEMVQKDARLKRLAMQVDYHTELEERLPVWLLNRIDKKVLILRPNIISSGNLFPSLVRWFKKNGGNTGMSGATDKTAAGGMGTTTTGCIPTIATLAQSNAALMLEVNKVKSSQKDMHQFMEKQYDLIKLLVQKMDIVSEADHVDEGDDLDNQSGQASRVSTRSNSPIEEDSISRLSFGIFPSSPETSRGRRPEFPPAPTPPSKRTASPASSSVFSHHRPRPVGAGVPSFHPLQLPHRRGQHLPPLLRYSHIIARDQSGARGRRPEFPPAPTPPSKRTASPASPSVFSHHRPRPVGAGVPSFHPLQLPHRRGQHLPPLLRYSHIIARDQSGQASRVSTRSNSPIEEDSISRLSFGILTSSPETSRGRRPEFPPAPTPPSKRTASPASPSVFSHHRPRPVGAGVPSFHPLQLPHRRGQHLPPLLRYSHIIARDQSGQASRVSTRSNSPIEEDSISRLSFGTLTSSPETSRGRRPEFPPAPTPPSKRTASPASPSVFSHHRPRPVGAGVPSFHPLQLPHRRGQHLPPLLRYSHIIARDQSGQASRVSTRSNSPIEEDSISRLSFAPSTVDDDIQERTGESSGWFHGIRHTLSLTFTSNRVKY